MMVAVTYQGHSRELRAKFVCYNHSLYMHCFNLTLVKTCGGQVQAVKNLIGIEEEATNFARDSPKRLELLKKKIQDHCPHVTGDTLLPLSETRLVERYEAFLRFKDLLPARKQRTGEALVKASGLHYSIMNFQFILALDVVHVMKCTLHLSRQLQSPKLDIVRHWSRQFQSPKLDIGQAEDMAPANVIAIENFRSLFKESVKFSLDNSRDIKIPRITARSAQRCNIPETNLEAY
ncbi:hypothetical protein PR048_003663 [Dryococelus australis]|uniref:Uncharacterized protein n=1 Tax=Dryococelus australis TaxID=614101 RepID=A0ABQ9INR1_9NEOP|nr:hypothetical protein PR048_003663 [Dryococelus australis]